MALYSFSLEDLTAVSCRSKSGTDDLWLITIAKVGNGAPQGASTAIVSGAQAGERLSGLWSAGPYDVADGATVVAVYTLVNLRGSEGADQEKLIAGLQADIAAALAQPGSGGNEEAAIRRLFGPAGEFLRAPGVNPGTADCQGLIGIHVAPFQGLNSPMGDEVALSGPVSFSETAPPACGTAPRSTAVFSVRVGPNLFDPGAPVTLQPTDITSMEAFAVGLDGGVWSKVRDASGMFGAWKGLGTRAFSQRVPLVAVGQPPAWKRLFGIGVDGVIYGSTWDAAAGWQDWVALSNPGQFAHDTPLTGLLSGSGAALLAVDALGIAQDVAVDGGIELRPIGGATFAPKTPLLAVATPLRDTEAILLDQLGQLYRTSMNSAMTGPGIPAAAIWNPWQAIGGKTGGPATMHGTVTGIGAAAFQVDGQGNILAMVVSGGESWGNWQIVPGLQTIPRGWVSAVSTRTLVVLYSRDPETGAIRQTTNAAPQNPAGWSAWESIPFGPTILPGSAVSAVCTGDDHIELFVIDAQGQMRRLGWRPTTGWGHWAVVWAWPRGFAGLRLRDAHRR